MSRDCSDVTDTLADLLQAKGYAIHNGNAETGDTVDDESGDDWWFTFTQGGDVECGETCTSMLSATEDALIHWFDNSLLDCGSPEPDPAPARVWVARYDTDNGSGVGIFATKEAAVEAVVEWCEEGGWLDADGECDEGLSPEELRAALETREVSFRHGDYCYAVSEEQVSPGLAPKVQA